jgi:soluble lytic murein transglycosylase
MMRWIGWTLSRLFAVAALHAGAAYLLTPAVRAAEPAGTEQTAMAVPRVALPGTLSEVAIPQPLSPADAALARRILAEQAHGRLAQATSDQASLHSDVLLGPILADRYLARLHRASVGELKAWLRAYGDQADAPAIHALLARRLTPAAPPPLPVVPALAPETLTAPEPEETEPGEASMPAPPPEMLMRIAVARGLFTRNLDDAAYRMAVAAWRDAPASQRIGRAAFIAGLAAWRSGRIGAARGWFERAATAPVAPATVRASGAFWASRAALRLRDPAGSVEWLRRAARERRTFHGLIARRLLGWGTGLILGRDMLSEADLDALAARSRGLRAFALLQVGQRARAEAELRRLWPEVADNSALARALLLAASAARLTDLAAQVAGLVQAASGIPHDDLRFPVPRLRPRGGFVVDSALIYGITRTESNFDAAAVSPTGALGLMQIMPVTARAVSGEPRLTSTALRDPAFNLGLGERVILGLAGLDAVHGDLIRLLAGYNAGATSLAAWAGGVHGRGDPLLFIEAIPKRETRRFVERALTYTWIYAARLGLPARSLDEIAAGHFPRFDAPSFNAGAGAPTLAAWTR